RPCALHTPDLPSFPTRRSSDLLGERRLTWVTGVVLHDRDATRRPPPERGDGEVVPAVAAEVRRFDVGDARPAIEPEAAELAARRDRKSTRLNSSHQIISYAVFC